MNDAFGAWPWIDWYDYTPLAGEHDIRLLTILPGKFGDDIRILLEHFTFTQTSNLEFEALSYTWGSDNDPVDIFLGVAGFKPLAVTQNLAVALRYLRYEDRSRVMWIDAICVNQDDLRERSQQVQRMTEIYSLATRVVAWIGEEGDGSSIAIRALDDLAKKVKVDRDTCTMSPALDDPHEAHWSNKELNLPYDEEMEFRFYHLFFRTWFERLWIWQEIKLSHSDSVLQCGKEHILWENFATSVFVLVYKGSKNLRRIVSDDIWATYAKRLEMIFDLCNPGVSPSFGSIAYRTSNCRYTEPRDRVFALLALVHPARRPNVPVDYAASVSTVFQDLALFVGRYYPPDPNYPTFESGLKAMQDLEALALIMEKGSHGQDDLEERISTDSFVLGLMNDMCGRCFYFTREGRMGTGPHQMREGDQVVVLLGCPSPLILRPDDQDEGLHAVVGETYYHGAMEGQAILGPLPKGIDVIWHLVNTSWYPGFIDRDSGVISHDDPRLEDWLSETMLPWGWRRGTHVDAPGIPFFVHIETGKWYCTAERDPRLTASALYQEKGVLLQSFFLR